MSIAKPEQSGYHRVITKILVSGAVALGAWVGAAAPASADPNSYGPDSNPFGNLACGCQVTAPPSGPALTQELNRGIQGGLVG
jgi:hypothetical protein